MGSPKVGKTSILKEVYEKVAGEEGYIFLEMYKEKGASKIENIIYEDVETWEKFDEIVSDIEENKDSDYPNLRVVVIDTWDNAIALAEKEAIRLYNKENPDNKKKTVNEIYGGYQRGQDKAADLLDEMTFRLENVGVKVSIIMHVKNKDIQDLYSDKTYQQLTSDVTQKYFNRIKRNVDLVAVAYIDREIALEKTGKKDFKGKEQTKGVIKDEVRKIKFRDSGYAIDAGGRLRYIVEEIPFNADDFISAIEDALKKEVESAGVSLKERAKEDAKNEKEAIKKASENSAKARESKIDPERNAELMEQIKPVFMNKEAPKEILDQAKAYMKENDIPNFKDIDSIPTAKLEEILRIVSQV